MSWHHTRATSSVAHARLRGRKPDKKRRGDRSEGEREEGETKEHELAEHVDEYD